MPAMTQLAIIAGCPQFSTTLAITPVQNNWGLSPIILSPIIPNDSYNIHFMRLLRYFHNGHKGIQFKDSVKTFIPFEIFSLYIHATIHA
jgi:hypothetical protein